LLLLAEHYDGFVYGAEEQAAIASRVRLLTSSSLTAGQAQARPDLLAEVEVLFTGGGCPVLGPEWLRMMPKLRAVFYAAGSIRRITTPAFWARGIPIVSAVTANAVPVAEFTMASIIFGLKRAFFHADQQRRGESWWGERQVHGAFGSMVGLISMGTIGRLVRERLRVLDVGVLVYDPFLTADQARQLQVEKVSLEELFTRSDVVSVHTPWLPETENLIRGCHLAALKDGAAFINTARGAVVHETELVEVLRVRPDVQAILDVTYPEPPAPDSPLRTLPNVFLTPHIAGSVGHEYRRLGRLMIEEFDRWKAGEPLWHAITRERAATMA
jgi:phosphoglycerate dehydrogenase-like enzyme